MSFLSQEVLFWLIAMILATGVAGFVLWPMLRNRTETVATPLRFDLQVYRDQLAEVEKDLDRGVLTADEADRTRTEVSRRILDADKAASADLPAGQAARKVNLTIAGLSLLVMLGGTAGVYVKLGAQWLPDLSLEKRRAQMNEARAQRPTQDAAEGRIGNATDMADRAEDSYKVLVAQLRETAKSRPDDLRGQELLAEHEARLGNFAAARIAKGRAIALMGADVKASDHTDHAELMIIAAGGYVSPEAEGALSAAIKLDPKDPRARYYSGLDLAQNGRPDLTYRLWIELLAEGPENAPWIAPIRGQIADVARFAGIKPTQLPGPSAEQIEDAGEMTAEDRQQMIRDMVTQLSERLATEGGTASEWARLIRAQGVLGNTERAAAIWTEAQAIFGEDNIAMAELLAAAQSAGVAD